MTSSIHSTVIFCWCEWLTWKILCVRCIIGWKRRTRLQTSPTPTTIRCHAESRSRSRWGSRSGDSGKAGRSATSTRTRRRRRRKIPSKKTCKSTSFRTGEESWGQHRWAVTATNSKIFNAVLLAWHCAYLQPKKRLTMIPNEKLGSSFWKIYQKVVSSESRNKFLGSF